MEGCCCCIVFCILFFQFFRKIADLNIADVRWRLLLLLLLLFCLLSFALSVSQKNCWYCLFRKPYIVLLNCLFRKLIFSCCAQPWCFTWTSPLFPSALYRVFLLHVALIVQGGVSTLYRRNPCHISYGWVPPRRPICYFPFRVFVCMCVSDWAEINEG